MKSTQLAPKSIAFGLTLAVVGAIAFSGKAIIVKLAYRHGVDAMTLIMLRMLFALPFFLAMSWWASRPTPRRSPAPLTRGDWTGVVLLGFTGYYLASFLDFADLAYINASLERLILYLNPTLVLLLSLVFLAGASGTDRAWAWPSVTSACCWCLVMRRPYKSPMWPWAPPWFLRAR